MGKILQESVAKRQVEVFYSNQPEVLCEKLSHNLLKSGSLFSKKLLLVPSRPIEEWIKKTLAESHIFAGATFSFLENGVASLSKELCANPEKGSFPRFSTLYFLVLHELQKDPLALKTYLNNEENKAFLALRLASLFKRYALYAHLGWEEEVDDWQKDIYKNVFKHISYDLDALKWCSKGQNALSVDLFLFHHLPAKYFTFFEKVAAFLPVRLYHLSPTSHFWSDVRSPKEQRFFEQKLREEGVAVAPVASEEDINPLLLSWGKVGRKMAHLLETREVLAHECYKEANENTQLACLQNGWLNLRDKSGSYDGSISFHSCTTKHNEIEVLKEYVVTLLNQNPHLTPGDIVVMAPDMGEYLPFIAPTFRGCLGVRISDVAVQTQDPVVLGLLQVFALIERRFSALGFLELLSHPLVVKHHHLYGEDIAHFRRFIEEMGVLWGVDKEQLQDFVMGPMDDDTATFEAGIDALMQRYATSETNDFSALEGLEKCFLLLELVRQRTNSIVKKEKATLTDWCTQLETLVEELFGTATGVLSHTFVQWRKEDRGDLLSFDILYALLEQSLSDERVVLNKNDLQTLFFCSMLPMRAVPAKVVCLLGMHLDAFPRKETLGALDLLKRVKTDYCPSRFDFDRYLFLESLLTARERVYISFQGRNPKDLSPVAPSILVSELIDYLGAKVTEHPSHTLPLVLSRVSTFIELPSELSLPEGDFELSLFDLKRAVSSPLKNYLQKKLGIYTEEKEPLAEEEPLVVSSLHKSALKQEALYHSYDVAIEGARHLPLGPFKKLATHEIALELDKLQHFLRSQKVASEEIQVIECPSLRLQLGENTTVVLRGKLSGVTPAGLLVDQKDAVKALLRAYPLFLMYSLQEKGRGKPLLLAKSAKSKDPFFKEPLPLLKTFCRYALLSMHFPFPFATEWIPPIIEGNAKGLEKKIKQAFTGQHAPLFDSALNYAYRLDPLPSANALIGAFHDLLSTTFKEVKDAWL